MTLGRGNSFAEGMVIGVESKLVGGTVTYAHDHNIVLGSMPCMMELWGQEVEWTWMGVIFVIGQYQRASSVPSCGRFLDLVVNVPAYHDPWKKDLAYHDHAVSVACQNHVENALGCLEALQFVYELVTGREYLDS